MAWASARCKPQARAPLRFATRRAAPLRNATHTTEALGNRGRSHHLLQAHEPSG